MAANMNWRLYCYISLFIFINTCLGSEVSRFQALSNSSTSLMLRWNSKYADDNSRSFRVFLNGEAESTCKAVLGDARYMCTIDNLIPNTMYEVALKICPTAEIIPSKCEQPVEPRRVTTHPQAPDTFKAVAIAGESIQFSWNLPMQNLKNLIVHASASTQNSTGVSAVSAEEGVNTTIIKGLKPQTEYTTKIFVENTFENTKDYCKAVIMVFTAPDPAPTTENTQTEENILPSDKSSTLSESTPIDETTTSSAECLGFAFAGIILTSLVTRYLIKQ